MPLGALRHAPLAAALAASLGLLPGCDVEPATASSATLTYTEDARLAYEEAMDAYRGKDWEDARALFAEVKKRFPFTRYARLADLRIADVEFEQEKYPEAVAAYRSFVNENRTDPDLEYARYRIVRALYLQISDTVLLPPSEERDQSATAEAHKEVRGFLREYPRSRWREEAEYMRRVTVGRLVRHELYVARYYLKRDAFDATLARIDHALKTYPGSDLEPEALVLRGETLLKQKKRDEAKLAFERVLSEHAASPFATTARDFLAEMGGRR